jgi:serine/threonine-protein kinase
MAEVWLARDRLGRRVVLKQLRAGLDEDDEARAMFRREARVAGALRHRNIVRVRDPEPARGEMVLALEYVEGIDLRRLLTAAVRRRGALPLGVALGIVREVAVALDHAHEARDGSGRPLGIVHRDISPDNVLVDAWGNVKLGDFGIARVRSLTRTTRADWIKGKAGYMAPEQGLGGHVDRRADVFSLGVLLYECTTGFRAFCGRTTYETTNLVLSGTYVPAQQVRPGYPEALARLVARMLARSPEARPHRARDVVDALDRIAHGRNLDTSRRRRARIVAGLSPREPRRGRTGWAIAAMAGAAVVLVGASPRTLSVPEGPALASVPRSSVDPPAVRTPPRPSPPTASTAILAPPPRVTADPDPDPARRRDHDPPPLVSPNPPPPRPDAHTTTTIAARPRGLLPPSRVAAAEKKGGT